MQVAPTGFSAFVDPDGNVSQRTDVSERAVIEADVERLDGTTPAQALGDVPAVALAIGVLVVLAVLAWRKRRRRGVRRTRPTIRPSDVAASSDASAT